MPQKGNGLTVTVKWNKQDRKYSYADYLNWNEDERWKVLDGIAYMRAAPSGIHQEISGELHRQAETPGWSQTPEGVEGGFY